MNGIWQSRCCLPPSETDTPNRRRLQSRGCPHRDRPHRHAVGHFDSPDSERREAIALNQARRIVHSELQHARMKSVTSNLVMRVQFNCPAAGQFRMLELLGTQQPPRPRPAANRCSGTVYPFRRLVEPRHAAEPGRTHPPDRPAVSFAAVRTIEFRPTGTAYSVNGDGTSGPPLQARAWPSRSRRDRSRIGHGECSWQNQ